MLEGLKAEQQISETCPSSQRTVQHPAQAHQAAAPGQDSSSQLCYGSLPHQSQPAFPEASTHVLEGPLVIGSEIEESQLGRGALLGDQPVEVPSSPLLNRVFQMPVMFLQNVTAHHQEAGNRSEHKQQR